MAENAKSRARARSKNKGLAPILIDIDTVETAINEKDCLDMEMIDEDKPIAKGLDESRWVIKALPKSTTSPTSSTTSVDTFKPTEQINLPLTTSLPVFQVQQCTSPSSKEPVVVDLSASQACPNTPSPSVPHDTPSTIETQAEQRRAAQTAANIEICSAAINSVEAVLDPLSNGTRNNFVASLKVYFRSAIAQFIRSGASTSLPMLPPRPTGPPQAVSIIRKSTRNTPTTKAILKNAAQNPTRSNWATIANKAHQKSPAIPNMSQCPISKMTEKSTTKSSSLSGADDRLFIRITKDHEWRLLSPCVVREKLCIHLNCSPSDICQITRTSTGYALTTKDREVRQMLLNNNDGLSSHAAKLEPASDLTINRIATVLVALRTLDGLVTVDDTNFVAEITRVTNVTPKIVRLHGKSRPGAPYCSWLAYFTRDQSPRPGFRLFDESGVAVVNKPRQPIQQCKRCKRCHGFHATRGCSRAPACENCGSTMHAITECKAPTRRCNCGGPHKSDSTNCFTRPSRSGPVRKDQIKIIRQMGQREYHAKVRTEAAVMRAEAAAVAAELLPTIDQNNDQVIISTNEVSMSEAFIEETIPET
ncbi:hypothetical protein EPUL_003788 [Erysiphe pulchra]|uniref:Uncharacterized protein n=1 Tax=Erysiphe pulchra TaxID=225359 RepID=A0A2S4PNP8_9PEZI|nr:hypothetical protein EPUL_003788 [Erysiphe pulchra]